MPYSICDLDEASMWYICEYAGRHSLALRFVNRNMTFFEVAADAHRKAYNTRVVRGSRIFFEVASILGLACPYSLWCAVLYPDLVTFRMQCALYRKYRTVVKNTPII